MADLTAVSMDRLLEELARVAFQARGSRISGEQHLWEAERERALGILGELNRRLQADPAIQTKRIDDAIWEARLCAGLVSQEELTRRHGGRVATRSRDESRLQELAIETLRREAVSRVERHLGVPFTSQTLVQYMASSGVRLHCHSTTVIHDHAYTYWFGVDDYQLGLLKEAKPCFVALACASPDRVLLFSGEEFQTLIEHMNFSGRWWQIRVQWGEAVYLDQPKGSPSRLDVTGRVLAGPHPGG